MIEPAVINADVVATYLERMHMPRMASWARSIGNAIAREQFLAEEWQRRHSDVLKALRKYEPEVRHTPVSCVPPPESSD